MWAELLVDDEELMLVPRSGRDLVAEALRAAAERDPHGGFGLSPPVPLPLETRRPQTEVNHLLLGFWTLKLVP